MTEQDPIVIDMDTDMEQEPRLTGQKRKRQSDESKRKRRKKKSSFKKKSSSYRCTGNDPLGLESLITRDPAGIVKQFLTGSLKPSPILAILTDNTSHCSMNGTSHANTGVRTALIEWYEPAWQWCQAIPDGQDLRNGYPSYYNIKSWEDYQRHQCYTNDAERDRDLPKLRLSWETEVEPVVRLREYFKAYWQKRHYLTVLSTRHVDIHIKTYIIQT